MKKKIKQRGLHPATIPDQILDHITESAIKVAEMGNSPGNAQFNTALVQPIDGSIELLGMFLRDDPKSPLIQKMQQTMPHLRGSFKL